MYVVKAKTGRVMGRYATKAEAEARTAQLARQAEALKAHRFGKGAGRGRRAARSPSEPKTQRGAESRVASLVKRATAALRLGDPGGAWELEREAKYLAVKWGVELPRYVGRK
jgi:hypothetical protein